MKAAAHVSIALAACLCCCGGGASAQTVSMAGSLGTRALLVIDGKPKSVAVGATVDGVHLVSVTGNDAVIDVQGKRVVVQLGGAQVNLGGTASGGTGSQIVLTAQSGGHFLTSGTINGTSVRFMVDTGATSIAMSTADAERIGLDYKKGRVGYASTANGQVAAYQVQLTTVQIGDVQVYNVDATVVPAQLPFVLLGNSFLSRFQMRRENDRMTLDKRF